METKWFICENVGDDEEITIVELTIEEASVIRKFLDNQITICQGGDFISTTNFFDNKPYNTREEAENAVRCCDYYH